MGETAADRTQRDKVRVITAFGMHPRASDIARLRDAIRATERNGSTPASNPVTDAR